MKDTVSRFMTLCISETDRRFGRNYLLYLEAQIVRNLRLAHFLILLTFGLEDWGGGSRKKSPFLSLAETVFNEIQTTDRLGRPGFNPQEGQEIFIFSVAARPTLLPTQPPIHWITLAICQKVKRTERGATH
jgi:hypothetical protein